jgi:hypothetical protein
MATPLRSLPTNELESMLDRAVEVEDWDFYDQIETELSRRDFDESYPAW